jgi:hypothetical protein
MAGQLRVDELTNEAGTGAPSFPNKITPSSLGTGSPSSANFLRGDGAWSTVPDPIPSGTAMMFVQTAAPTGWTKSTTHDNKALRVVSGTASSGGSVAFTTAFGTPSVSGSVSLSGTVGSTTLSTAQLASHTHTVAWASTCGGSTAISGGVASAGINQSTTTSSTGSNSSHTHSFSGSGSLSSATATINVAYVDVIIATKD